MNVGGVFDKMYEQPSGIYVPLGLILLAAVLTVFVFVRDKHRLRALGFLLTGLMLTTVGVLLLPGAVRIHHAVLAFPFPQLIIATALAILWTRGGTAFAQGAVRTSCAVALLLLFVLQIHAIARTEKLISQTGGRGRWSDAFDRFCRENKDRSDIVIASLDWGFNEQAAFLTDGPQLVEPFWAFPRYNGALPALPPRPQYLYLAHPPEYSLFKYDVGYLNELRTSGEGVEIQPYADREGQAVFYTIRFRE
jgi:hypothetical protein